MFSVLIGFAELYARCSPAALADCVNSVFDVFDGIVYCHSVYKARLHHTVRLRVLISVKRYAANVVVSCGYAYLCVLNKRLMLYA